MLTKMFASLGKKSKTKTTIRKTITLSEEEMSREQNGHYLDNKLEVLVSFLGGTCNYFSQSRLLMRNKEVYRHGALLC